MGSAFQELIFSAAGHIALDKFIELALYHERYGYYMTRVPFGKDGDFITSAEITQLFGEVMAIWLLHHLESVSLSKRFSLVELGPGNGTMMSDMLRIMRQFPKYYDLLDVHLVEISPILRKMQENSLREALIEGKVFWHDNILTLPQNYTIVIANEFFDALPVRQFVYSDGIWKENYVHFSGKDLSIIAMNTDYPLNMFDAPEGGIVERCEAAGDIINALEGIIVRHGGAAVIVDYGYLQIPYKSTVQAVKNHQYCCLLDHVGECDITAWVDFGFLQQSLKKVGCNTITQREFLYRFGIRERFDCLVRHATTKQASMLKEDFLRLTENMGTMFKVLLLNSPL